VPNSKVKLAVFISGNGSNMKALYNSCETGRLASTELVLVVSNKETAGGLAFAKDRGLKTHTINFNVPSWDLELINILRQENITDIALAGFMKIIPERFIQEFDGHIFNIHPSLLPKYGGIGMYGNHVHNAVIANEERESGCTVHLVTSGVDEGSIIGQKKINIIGLKSAEELAAKVLELEHALYSEALNNYFKLQYGDAYYDQ
jgi:phosphoribosylglycinamide formyltransferase 1